MPAWDEDEYVETEESKKYARKEKSNAQMEAEDEEEEMRFSKKLKALQEDFGKDEVISADEFDEAIWDTDFDFLDENGEPDFGKALKAGLAAAEEKAKRDVQKAKAKKAANEAKKSIQKKEMAEISAVVDEVFNELLEDAASAVNKSSTSRNANRNGRSLRPGASSVTVTTRLNNPYLDEDGNPILSNQKRTMANTNEVKTLIPQSKIDFWIANNVNVMMIGKHGIGKTHIGKAAAKNAGLKFVYFSCATLDPWVDFIGIPQKKTVSRDDGTGKKKVSYLEIVRPKAFAFDEVEFLFLDELNRADPKVWNAVLELIQFRSINGKKFKNLKCIWAAINPPASETGDVAYHVQELDPALMTRFQVKIELPFAPASDYFIEKFGKSIGRKACSWWHTLPENAKDEFPPRSMDYALEFIKKGGDVDDVLPKSVSKSDFIQVLDKDFNPEMSAPAPSYDLIEACSSPLSVQLLRDIRYAANRREASTYLKRVRESSMEDVTRVMLEVLEEAQSGREASNHLNTLVASLSKPIRTRMLSTLFTAYMAAVSDDDEEDDENEVVSHLELNEDQIGSASAYCSRALEKMGAEFKYSKKTKSYILSKLDHDELYPCENQSKSADDILEKMNDELRRSQVTASAGY